MSDFEFRFEEKTPKNQKIDAYGREEELPWDLPLSKMKIAIKNIEFKDADGRKRRIMALLDFMKDWQRSVYESGDGNCELKIYFEEE